MMASDPSSGTSHGRIAIVVRSTDSFATRASTNSTMPIGGCNRPIIRFSTITRPKWTRSMPRLWQIGTRIGTRMVIAAVGSRKQPTNSISRFASSRNTQGSLVKASTQDEIAAVTPVAVSIQPKMLAAATMKSTVAVVSTVSRQTLTNIFQFNVRYHAKPSTMAQRQAAIAPSVGVKMPVTMPPISSTGVMIGSTAWNLNNLSAANSTTSAASTVSCAGRPAFTTSSQTASGHTITTAVSVSALMTRGHSNFTSAPQPFL